MNRIIGYIALVIVTSYGCRSEGNDKQDLMEYLQYVEQFEQNGLMRTVSLEGNQVSLKFEPALYRAAKEHKHLISEGNFDQIVKLSESYQSWYTTLQVKGSYAEEWARTLTQESLGQPSGMIYYLCQGDTILPAGIHVQAGTASFGRMEANIVWPTCQKESSIAIYINDYSADKPRWLSFPLQLSENTRFTQNILER